MILKKGTIEDYISVYEYEMMKVRDIGGEFILEKQDPNKIRGWFSEGMTEYYKNCSTKIHTFDWIIYLKENMIPIGNVTSDRERNEMNASELAYNLHPNYWGEEYMVEAVSAVLDHLFSIGYENVLSGWDEGNKKSKRVSEKLGFSLFRVIDDYWIKDGKGITAYESVMNKQKWYDLNKDNRAFNDSKRKL